MADAELSAKISTTSDIPDAMDKAKKATVSFEKQVEGIQKKFSTSFKDIFLSFLGPMALLGAAMAFIGKMIADNQKKQEDANQAAIDGTNNLMSAEDKYYANKRNNEKKDKQTVEEAKTQREETTLHFLENDPRAVKMVNKRMGDYEGEDSPFFVMKRMSRSKAVQDEVQALIAADMKNNPAASAALKESTFKGPAGFSNVVGVGANPVMEAMMSQLEESRKQTALLEVIARPATGGGVPVDFTKDSTSSTPSRSSMLTGK